MSAKIETGISIGNQEKEQNEQNRQNGQNGQHEPELIESEVIEEDIVLPEDIEGAVRLFDSYGNKGKGLEPPSHCGHYGSHGIQVIYDSNSKSSRMVNTPLQFCERLTEQIGVNLSTAGQSESPTTRQPVLGSNPGPNPNPGPDPKVYFKRDDLTPVRSFKIRGAFNKIASLPLDIRARGVVTVSAGNHAQGVAYSCNYLKIRGVIFMPTITTKQKIERVLCLGKEFVEVKIIGDSFEASKNESLKFCSTYCMTYVHPYDDKMTIAGQGTMGHEILRQAIDMGIPSSSLVILCPIGGGGLISGLSVYLKAKNESITMIGIEAKGSASMYNSLVKGQISSLDSMDTFADGIAIRRPGNIPYALLSQRKPQRKPQRFTLRKQASGDSQDKTSDNAKTNIGDSRKLLDDLIIVDEKDICKAMIELYQNEGIITEPAGAISVAALNQLIKQSLNGGLDLTGKTIVCIISGGNNDIHRYSEILERASLEALSSLESLDRASREPRELRENLDRVLS